jgi:hypothetical protein
MTAPRFVAETPGWLLICVARPFATFVVVSPPATVYEAGVRKRPVLTYQMLPGVPAAVIVTVHVSLIPPPR